MSDHDVFLNIKVYTTTSSLHIIIIIIIMIMIIIIIIKPYLSAHTQLSPYAQQIQTTIYNEKQYETNTTKLI